MTLADLRRLANAVAFARAVGTPLTAHVTLIWNRVPGFTTRAWHALESRLLNLLSGWAARRRIPFAWVYVRENVRGRGPHTHLLLHLPPSRWTELRDELRAFLLKVGGFRGRDAVMVSGDAYGTPGMLTARQNAGLVRYLAKALDPEALVYTGVGVVPLVGLLGVQPSLQAEVTARRVGVSRSLGASRRAAAGWVDPCHHALA